MDGWMDGCMDAWMHVCIACELSSILAYQGLREGMP